MKKFDYFTYDVYFLHLLKRYTDVYRKETTRHTNNHVNRFSTFCYADYGRNEGRPYSDHRAFSIFPTPNSQILEFGSDRRGKKTKNARVHLIFQVQKIN